MFKDLHSSLLKVGFAPSVVSYDSKKSFRKSYFGTKDEIWRTYGFFFFFACTLKSQSQYHQNAKLTWRFSNAVFCFCILTSSPFNATKKVSHLFTALIYCLFQQNRTAAGENNWSWGQVKQQDSVTGTVWSCKVRGQHGDNISINIATVAFRVTSVLSEIFFCLLCSYTDFTLH